MLQRATREAEQLKMKLALGGASSASAGGAGRPGDDTLDVDGVKLVARRVEGLEKAGAARRSPTRSATASAAASSSSRPSNDGKVTLVVSVTKDLTSRVQAGRLVKELAPMIGGGGGGRPDFAEAGGKDPVGHRHAGPESPRRTQISTTELRSEQCSFRTPCPEFRRKLLVPRGHRLCESKASMPSLPERLRAQRNRSVPRLARRR